METAKDTRDLTGRRFGKLTAMNPTPQRQHGHIVWECKCDCGNTTFATANNLKRGNTQSCGCMHKQIVAQKSRTDLSGRKFGRLTVLRQTDKRANGSVVWECQCDCGNTTLVSAAELKKGDTTSCGCLAKEKLGKRRSVDLSGRRFGYLTAIHPTQKRVHGCVVWECKCDCGETTFIPSERLTGGVIISCGCISLKEYVTLH